MCVCGKVERKIKTKIENFLCSAIHQILLWPSWVFFSRQHHHKYTYINWDMYTSPHTVVAKTQTKIYVFYYYHVSHSILNVQKSEITKSIFSTKIWISFRSLCHTLRIDDDCYLWLLKFILLASNLYLSLGSPINGSMTVDFKSPFTHDISNGTMIRF